MVAANLLAPIAHHLRLLGVVRPLHDGGANFLDNGFGPPAFHQRGFGAGAKVGQAKARRSWS